MYYVHFAKMLLQLFGLKPRFHMKLHAEARRELSTNFYVYSIIELIGL